MIDDFVALGFLPTSCDRALIMPVMERVLSPYLRGGGAAAFNFQALSQVGFPSFPTHQGQKMAMCWPPEP